MARSGPTDPPPACSSGQSSRLRFNEELKAHCQAPTIGMQFRLEEPCTLYHWPVLGSSGRIGVRAAIRAQLTGAEKKGSGQASAKCVSCAVSHFTSRSS